MTDPYPRSTGPTPTPLVVMTVVAVRPSVLPGIVTPAFVAAAIWGDLNEGERPRRWFAAA